MVLTLCFKVLLYACSVFVLFFFVVFFLTQIRKNRCDSYKKRRPCVLSNISIVAISVGLPVAVSNGNGNGLLFHMTQPIRRSTIKAIACSKPTISEH